MGPLGEIYARGCPGAAIDDAFEARLAESCAASARAWPSIAVPAEELVAALAARARPESPPPTDDAAREMLLALGCARRDRVALLAFEREVLTAVGPSLASMDLPPSMVDEVSQEVRRKLLVVEPGRSVARIVDYAGEGTLRGLVAVVAARTALDLLRRARRQPSLDDRDELFENPAGAAFDPQRLALKAELHHAFKAAFAEAASKLGPRDRNLLRLHYLDGLTLDLLASMYGVHRATVVRWIAEVRSRLLSVTRSELRKVAGVAEGELDSVMAVIESGLEISVRRLLDEGEKPGEEPSST